ncbi:MAG: MBL fold metallo-hydrolase [Alphaproteobacteria bacterium]
MANHSATDTTIDEIEDGIYRIFTPIELPGAGGFSFNQYLIVDDEPLLFHTGLRKMFPVIREAIARVMPPERLRWISFSHFEADECGALNEFLAIAPRAEPLCGRIAAMVSVDDVADRPARTLADGETLSLGRRTVRWFDTPHLPHAWECGMLMETTRATLLCSDLFTQPGSEHVPVTEGDILGPSEAARRAFDYYAHAKNTGAMIERLAATNPKTLACMHGSAWRGDGASMLRSLARALEAN